MLAVVSERFPKGGAITIGAIGGIGMLSAGLLGGPGIGFKQDYHASAKLKETGADIYDRYKAANENSFLGFKTLGLDGTKVGVLTDESKDGPGTKLKADLELIAKAGGKDENLSSLMHGGSKTRARPMKTNQRSLMPTCTVDAWH